MEIERKVQKQIYDDYESKIFNSTKVVMQYQGKDVLAEFVKLDRGLIEFRNLTNGGTYKVRPSSIDFIAKVNMEGELDIDKIMDKSNLEEG